MYLNGITQNYGKMTKMLVNQSFYFGWKMIRVAKRKTKKFAKIANIKIYGNFFERYSVRRIKYAFFFLPFVTNKIKPKKYIYL